MNKSEFFSNSSYIFLPTRRNPKVALVVDNAQLVENAFELYNPFSKKAKLLKRSVLVIFTNFNKFSKFIWRTKKEKKSGFVQYLENKLGTPLVSSVYFSTIHDKVVMQLQTPDAKIIGYLKYPINEVGIKHIKNELNAIRILSKKNLIQEYILFAEFNSKPFVLIAALKGEIDFIEYEYIYEILSQFKRKKKYTLSEHPRVKELIALSSFNGLTRHLSIIERISQDSTTNYELAYEHGDFTPWNIIKVDGNYVPFDFEYFVEDGIEYFDLIKYYYQVGRLVEKKSGNELILFISKETRLKELKPLLQLFLIKEINRSSEENKSYLFEDELLVALEV